MMAFCIVSANQLSHMKNKSIKYLLQEKRMDHLRLTF